MIGSSLYFSLSVFSNSVSYSATVMVETRVQNLAYLSKSRTGHSSDLNIIFKIEI